MCKSRFASLVTIALFISCGCHSYHSTTIPRGTPADADRDLSVQTKESQQAMTPEEVLGLLRAGNARFVAGQAHPRDLRGQVRATASGQYPYAVIVSCLDSRQPAELIFDQGIGDVFNARVAGNVLDDEILGSLEFACKASGSKLILVLGHSNCGAVKGAIDHVELGHLTGLLDRIQPAISAVPDDGTKRDSRNDAFVQKVADANVHLVMQQIRERSPILREMIDNHQIDLVGSMYDLKTGQVTFYSK
jgi:carbonic anhydrase